MSNEEKLHAKYSASGSHIWMNCHGSIALTETICDEMGITPPQSEYSIEGTTAHSCLEFLMKNRKKIGSAKTMAVKKYGQEMVDHALSLVNWVEMNSGDAEILSEIKVDASPFTCDGQFGTLDIAIVDEFARLTIIDYKYGAGILVDPKENSQLIYYALGLSYQYDHNFTEVELIVYQPRAWSEDGKIHKSHVMPMSELLEWVPKFKTAVEICEDAYNAEPSENYLKSDPEWCRFCPAALICPEIKDAAMKRAGVVFEAFDGGTSIIQLPKLEMIPDLGSTLSACDQIETWISKVREHAFDVMKKGHKVFGWKLVEKRATRKWIDEAKAEKNAFKQFGDDAFTLPELLSPAQFEKTFKNTSADLFLKKHAQAKSSGLTIATSSDKREEVNIIEAAFSELDDEGKEIERLPLPKKKSPRKQKLKRKKK